MSEPEAPGTVFTWFFGDNTPPIETTSRTLSHTYSSPGSYDVLVIATDSLGNDAGAETRVTVTTSPVTPPPDVTPPLPAPFEEKIWYSFDGSSLQAWVALNFTPEADAVYNWDFGDGQTATSATGAISHRYNSIGTYTLTVSVAGRAISTTIVVYFPTVEILDQPIGEVPYGQSWSYTIKCNVGEKVFTDFTYNFTSSGYASTDIATCSDAGGAGENSENSIHTITCTPKTFSCPYTFTLTFANNPRFACGVIDNENNIIYKSDWVEANPLVLNFVIPGGCN